MASRFTDTEIWNEDWFCEMPGEYQLYTKYVFDKCDNAGIWKPNKFDFEMKTKFKVSPDLLFKKMNAGGGGQQRVLLLSNGRWFLTGYLLFQWFNKKKTFDLVLTNRLHKSLYSILIENKVDLVKVRGLREVLQTSMVMDMGMVSSGEGGKGEEEPAPNLSPPISGWQTKPANAEMDLELPKLKVGAVIQLFKISKNQDATPSQVTSLWNVFKRQNFTGEKYYASANQVYSHFINWSKNQDVKSIPAEEQNNSVMSLKEQKARKIIGL